MYMYLYTYMYMYIYIYMHHKTISIYIYLYIYAYKSYNKSYKQKICFASFMVFEYFSNCFQTHIIKNHIKWQKLT